MLTTVLFIRDVVSGGVEPRFTFRIILWLWFTVLFANFAEAMAEGRGKAQAEPCVGRGRETQAQAARAATDGTDYEDVPATRLKIGDVVLVEAGDIIPVRRRGDRRRRLGQRGGDHRRIRAGDPREAAIAPRSPAARRCSPTGSGFVSRPRRARPSSTG